MSDDIFWVYNGWAILITALAPIYTMTQANVRILRFLLNRVFPIFFIGSVVALVFLSHWLTAVLYIPAWFLGIGLVNVLEALFGRRDWRNV